MLNKTTTIEIAVTAGPCKGKHGFLQSRERGYAWIVLDCGLANIVNEQWIQL